MLRPANVSRPALSLGLVAIALFAIARTTGSGWLIVILTAIATVVLLAFVLPVASLRRLTISVDAPRDATVGRSAELVVSLAGGSSPVKLRPLGPFTDPSWSGAVAPSQGGLVVVPSRRGVISSIEFELSSAAPLGLVWWRKRLTVPLARAFEVGPKPVFDSRDRVPPLGREDDNVVKTIREYVAGDPIKLVHWAATARAGELMVKELEAPTAPVLTIAVDLRVDDPEIVASRSAGLALEGLRAGVPVELLTCDLVMGPRAGRVMSGVEVGRRLARAVPGPLPQP
ncbi:MAG: hypothetical protein QOF60_486 [Actinomycetota bacterium]|jgi:uncharacterized protein (DUF58 family)|nr:hypothetical protein [Actinomycetota bacterium]